MSEEHNVKKQESELTPEQLEDAAGGQSNFKSGDSADHSGMAIEKVELSVEKVERVFR